MTAEELEPALAVDVEEWKAEIPQITEWFEKFGDNLPAVLWTELDGLQGAARRLTRRGARPAPALIGAVRDGCGILARWNRERTGSG